MMAFGSWKSFIANAPKGQSIPAQGIALGKRTIKEQAL